MKLLFSQECWDSAVEVEGQVARPYFRGAVSESENRDWLHAATPPLPV